jgi:two-component system, LytTR family, response regulator LytT
MKINCLIIEDEIPNANRLEKLLGQTDFEVTVLEKIATIKDAVIWLKNNPKPDLLLLDIRLSDGISFEIFKQIEIDIPIIFTTAYDEYAIQAFKVNSIDYLLKPIVLAELNTALHKLEKNKLTKPENDLSHILTKLKVNEPTYRNRFLITFREQFIPIDINQVAYFHSQNKITYLITHKNEHYIIDLTMERLEEELDPKQFFRASRQLIIKQESIHKISSHFNGKVKLDLSPALDAEVVLSREKSSALKEWLNN